MIIHKKWLFPYIGWHAETVHCHQLFNYSGASVLWFSLLVILPLFCSIILALVLLPIGIKGLRYQQFPPPGVKVYRPTRIVNGHLAKLKSLCYILAPLVFVLMAIWGYFQLEHMPTDVPEDYDFSVCEQPIAFE
ncbi:hypothetical protein [Shewanella waksmanii]|uniref:hypothetical protein n=1 Tax=Shewanella waksmanii TaxID=213783 RepID=UPI0037363A34